MQDKHTNIPPAYLGAVIVPRDGRMLPVVTTDAWFRLKELQQLEDGSSARINWERRDRLADMPSTHPATVANEIDAILNRARPRIAAACARARAALDGQAT